MKTRGRITAAHSGKRPKTVNSDWSAPLLRSRNLPIYGSLWERTFLQKPILKPIIGGCVAPYKYNKQIYKNATWGSADWRM
jgi:hypothetical protein